MIPPMNMHQYLASRRSVPLNFLAEPGPDRQQLEEILTLGVRVPDHGKLSPWRLVVYQGEARAEIGEHLARLAKEKNPALSEEQLEAERQQFLPAPVTIGVLSSPVEHPKIPSFEQLMSAGGVALNLVHAANALGFGAHWVTRWFAYDEQAARMLGARDGEQFVGFIHMGTPAKRLEDRPRPDLAKIVTHWSG